MSETSGCMSIHAQLQKMSPFQPLGSLVKDVKQLLKVITSGRKSVGSTLLLTNSYVISICLCIFQQISVHNIKINIFTGFRSTIFIKAIKSAFCPIFLELHPILGNKFLPYNAINVHLPLFQTPLGQQSVTCGSASQFMNMN